MADGCSYDELEKEEYAKFMTNLPKIKHMDIDGLAFIVGKTVPSFDALKSNIFSSRFAYRIEYVENVLFWIEKLHYCNSSDELTALKLAALFHVYLGKFERFNSPHTDYPYRRAVSIFSDLMKREVLHFDHAILELALRLITIEANFCNNERTFVQSNHFSSDYPVIVFNDAIALARVSDSMTNVLEDFQVYIDSKQLSYTSAEYAAANELFKHKVILAASSEIYEAYQKIYIGITV